MHFTWLGGSTIKIQTKPLDKDVVIVVDPYKPKVGPFPRSLAPQIALFSRGEKGSITLSGAPFTLSTPGECETSGVLMSATQGHELGQTLLRIDAEGMSVGHLGMANKAITNAQLETLSGIDILCVPVGGDECYDAEAAVKAVNAIEPRVVIPMAFKSENNPKAADVKTFLKEIGAKAGDPEAKVIIKKRDLPQEETRVIVLSKSS